MESFNKKFSASSKESNVKKDESKESGGEEHKKTKKGKDVLAHTKTDVYADDESLYIPRYTKKQRLVSIYRLLKMLKGIKP